MPFFCLIMVLWDFLSDDWDSKGSVMVLGILGVLESSDFSAALIHEAAHFLLSDASFATCELEVGIG